jgi:hypothetical protein
LRTSLQWVTIVKNIWKWSKMDKSSWK